VPIGAVQGDRVLRKFGGGFNSDRIRGKLSNSAI
jgi:hypothetical protein